MAIKSQSDTPTSTQVLLPFLGSLAALIVVINLLTHYFLFDLSNNLLIQLIPYKTPALSKFFGFISHLGEGRIYFVSYALLFGLGNSYQYSFFMNNLYGAYALSNLLKIIHHQPRPFFIDSALLDSHLIDCKGDGTGEFGSPSTHSLFSAVALFLPIIYFSEKYRPFFNLRPKLLFLIWTVTIIYVFLIGISRFYFGRHSIDQLLYGWLLGTWYAFFAMRYWKPFIIDDSCKPDSNHRLHFIYSLIGTSLFLFAVGLACIYTEHVANIPIDWEQQIQRICPLVTRYGMFQNISLTNCGVIFSFPGFYLFKWVNFKYTNYRAPYEDRPWNQLTITRTILCFIINFGLLFVTDKFLTKLLPILLFGSGPMDVIQEFWVKRVFHSFGICFASQLPFADFLQFRLLGEIKETQSKTLKGS